MDYTMRCGVIGTNFWVLEEKKAKNIQLSCSSRSLAGSSSFPGTLPEPKPQPEPQTTTTGT